jgi:hypothetical protein
MEVFDHFRPPVEIGYKRAEDKHFSLRVRTRYRLGVVCNAIVRHEGAHTHARFGLWRLGFYHLRSRAQLLRDCDPEPTILRYLAFLGFNLLHLPVRAAVALVRGDVRDLVVVLGSLAGWATCAVSPPRPTRDALRSTRIKTRAGAV